MDKYKKLNDLFKGLANKAVVVLPLINATVVSIDGESCTVDIDGLLVDEVRLKATINGEDNKILVLPKVGSMVLIGSLTGDLKDLAVLRVDEVAQLQYVQDGLNILIDSTDGRIQIANEAVSLHDLFQSLVDLLKVFKVYTPVGPSGTPLPDTITAITQFETDFKLILK
jgi:hypothetical protein